MASVPEQLLDEVRGVEEERKSELEQLQQEGATLEKKYRPYKEVIEKYEDFEANVTRIETEILQMDEQIEQLRRGSSERMSRGRMDRQELERRLQELTKERTAKEIAVNHLEKDSV